MVSKLVAGREKDHAFAHALIQAGPVKPEVLAERIEMIEVPAAVLRRLRSWIASYQSVA